MEDESSRILTKLLTNEHPVRFQRYKYEIQTLQQELDAIQKNGRPRIPGALLGWFKNRMPVVLELKAKAIKARIDELTPIWVDAVLVKLTEFEHILNTQKYMAIRLFLLEEMTLKLLSPRAKSVEERTIDISCESYYVATRVRLALRRKTADGWMPVFTEQDMSGVDHRLIRDLMEIYNQEFNLTQAQIKK